MAPKGKKSSFFRSREFKLFFTAWIIYIFYIQMYGSSCMANSNSALTASIVNEGRFEIDTYRRVSCDTAFYNGHYYSGMDPGISFISVPTYILGKSFFSLVPDYYIYLLFGKVESYSITLPRDFRGEEKVISNYFPDLDKRQMLEYLFISSFLLPVFSTSLFSAFSVVLLYLILRNFTNSNRIRLLISIFYAFGTLLFPLSTEFFQRPIAVSLIFASFFILFKIKHRKLSYDAPLFFSGLLAGLSVWFDYYHAVIAGLLAIYLFSFVKERSIKRENICFGIIGKVKLNRVELSALFRFAAGFVIPVILLLAYQYAAFDNPLTTAYEYKDLPPEASLGDYSGKGMAFLSFEKIMHIMGFFLYSPIIILAIYGLYMAIITRNPFKNEAILTASILIITFAYATFLALFVVYLPGYLPPSHKRYMLPVVPFLMIFLSYVFTNIKIDKKNKLNAAIIIIGLISLFFNWTAAQFGGHAALGQYSPEEQKFITGIDFLKQGPSSSFFNAMAGVFGLSKLVLNIAGLIVLWIMLFIIWRKPK